MRPATRFGGAKVAKSPTFITNVRYNGDMTHGALTSETGAILNDLGAADPLDVAIRARESAHVLSQVVEFLEQISRSGDSDLDAVHERDWQLDADTLTFIAQTLEGLADQAEAKDSVNE